MALSVKDGHALATFRKAAVVTHKILKHSFVRLLEDAFDQAKSITHEEIATFCETQFGVTFPMMAKIEVNGDNRHPLYAELCKVPDHEGKEAIKWNFNKFIVREDGSVERFSHRTEPSELPL